MKKRQAKKVLQRCDKRYRFKTLREAAHRAGYTHDSWVLSNMSDCGYWLFTKPGADIFGLDSYGW